MRSLFGELREHISGKGVRIVFPEGNDDRVVRAAARLKFEELVDPVSYTHLTLPTTERV